MPIVAVMGFFGLSVVCQYLPGATVKAVASVITNVILREKHLSQTMWLVPGSIYDGDMLRVERNGQELKIRLCGIDSPELEQPGGLRRGTICDR